MDNFISAKLGNGDRVGRMRRWTTKLKNGCSVSISRSWPGLSLCQFLSLEKKRKKKKGKLASQFSKMLLSIKPWKLIV